MTEPLVRLRHLLKQHGYSSTVQRVTLFKLLLGREPLSMQQLAGLAAPHMDRASVYRTVDLFERLAIIHRITIGWKYKVELADNFGEHHHHLTCLRCHQVIPINEQAFERFVESTARQHGFTPTAHQIEIQGRCAACQA